MESRFVDWSEALGHDVWCVLGREAMEEKWGHWSDDNHDGIEADDHIPIYNYAYPLGINALDEEKIIKICSETNCTVVCNQDEDALYLALCGCGMDLTQDIALAYMIAYSYGEEKYGRIPGHMLFDVYKSGPLSVGQDKFERIREKLIEGFENLKQSCERELESLKQ